MRRCWCSTTSNFDVQQPHLLTMKLVVEHIVPALAERMQNKP